MGRGLEVEGQEVARQEQKSWEVGQGQELGGLGRGLRASSIGPSDSMNHVVCPVCTLLAWAHIAEVPFPCLPLTGLLPSVPQGTKG